MPKTVKLYYAKLANMGDLLNDLILRRLFGVEVERCSFLTGDMSAIGSCLAQYTYHGNALMRAQQFINGVSHPRVAVWGTGFINYTDCAGRFFKREMDFRAVRGELTRRAVEKMTGRSLDIPTGDAGLLADCLLSEKPEPVYDVGIVPHLCDLKDPAVPALAARYENAVVIDVRDEPLAVVRQIARCRHILSSSLHGLIVADSFGVPNMHLVFDDRLLGDGFKFDDYYSAYGVPHLFFDLRSASAPELEEVSASYALRPEMVAEKKRALLACFPSYLIE